MSQPTSKPSSYLPAIDGIRTIAVFLVLGYHASVPGFQGGLLGVSIFFVLSGYLITTNLVKEYNRDKKINFIRFWLRRFWRLAPMVLTVSTAVVLLTIAFEPHRLGARIGEALSSVFYVNNWYTIIRGQSYFERFDGPGPLSHVWSLSIEEQFYIFWPLILFAFFFILRKKPFVIIFTIVLSAISFALMAFLFQPGVDPTFIYEGTHTRAGELLTGSALALILAPANGAPAVHRASIAKTALGIVTLGGILAMSICVPSLSPFWYRSGFLLNAALSALLLVALLPRLGLLARVLGFAPMAWLGQRSYAIYLWHMPVLHFLPREWTSLNPLLTFGIVALISVALAAITLPTLENPLRRYGAVGMRNTEVTQHTPMMPVYRLSFTTLLALVAIGTPPAVANRDTTQLPQAMEVTDEARQIDRHRKGDASTEEDETKDNTWGSQPADTLTDCHTVVHVGDSTSIGMFSPNYLPEGAESASQTYYDAGAEVVIDDVYGARAINQAGGDQYPAATASVATILANGVDDNTCWVIALGVNDAANKAAARQWYGEFDAIGEMESDIRTLLDMIGDDKIMWSTARTLNPLDGFYQQEEMEKFNSALRTVAKEYPNLVIYDWSDEIEENPEWFGEDGTHYSLLGNQERAKRFPAALKNAFPRGIDESTRPVGAEVSSKS